MAIALQSPEGTGLTRKQWEELNRSPEWTFKEYKGEKIWVRLHWVGRYDTALPPEYRHSHGVQVYNRLVVKGSEWEEEGTTVDKGWVLDPTASETFRTKSAAENAYEDLLIRYTASFIDVDEDGNAELIEEGNTLKPVVPGSNLIMDEAQIAAAEEKGVSIGGWS